MARLARPPTIWSDDDDDEFPDIATLVHRKKLQGQGDASMARPERKECQRMEEPAKPPTSVRRRKLVPLADNLLLRAWTPGTAREEKKYLRREKEDIEPRRGRELRANKTRPAVAVSSLLEEKDEEYVSAKEEVTVIEEVSMVDDTFYTCGSEDSEFEDTECDGCSDDDGGHFSVESPPRRPPAKPRYRGKDGKVSRSTTENEGRKEIPAVRTERRNAPGRSLVAKPEPTKGQDDQGKAKDSGRDLMDTLSRLRLDESEDRERKSSRSNDRDATPPLEPSKTRPGLVSPKKLPRIPATPHRPSSDAFWSQEFIDTWNDEHSPRKLLFPDAAAAKQRIPPEGSPGKKLQKSAATKKTSDREAKKAFESAKHEMAKNFLQELDMVITNGKLEELAASTGGVKLVWTNKLNTTAGRANWKRESVRTKGPDGNVIPGSTKHKHHASIELAEKVIDNEHRLLNVIAHEFCHLANFMVSGVTNNPHGREFKAWAAKCSRAFGDRGIEVTTKHTYDIDFKYVWQCVACGMEFKRHSKSIDPARHRCGSCRSELKQTKPVPRKKDGGEPGKVSGYQAFMKEQMRLVREENPKTPQKDIMKIVASRWAQRSKPPVSTPAPVPDSYVQEVVKDGSGL
ncbi:hypothetical protein VTK56DRAFT_3690 [Thermocarpiscus australiensis]